MSLQPLHNVRLTVCPNEVKQLSIEGTKDAVSGAAQTHGLLNHCIEHGREVAG
jgi:hypothetical protein